MTLRYIAVDLEATCWSAQTDPEMSARQAEVSEIIEIGAVGLDARLQRVREFQCFVRPERYPVLSDFCTELTSITQAEVDAAEPFPAAYQAFLAWLGGETAGLRFVSWSRYDHRQLMAQCRAAGLPRPAWEAIDAKEEFTDWCRGHTGKRLRYGLSRALAHLEIPREGTAHRGIDDARSLVRVFQHIRAPHNLSPRARAVLEAVADRHPLPTNVGHLAEVERQPRRGVPLVKSELLRLELVTDLGLGRGIQITPAGVDVATARA